MNLSLTVRFKMIQQGHLLENALIARQTVARVIHLHISRTRKNAKTSMPSPQGAVVTLSRHACSRESATIWHNTGVAQDLPTQVQTSHLIWTRRPTAVFSRTLSSPPGMADKQDARGHSSRL
jgi:hypothetical protein